MLKFNRLAFFALAGVYACGADDNSSGDPESSTPGVSEADDPQDGESQALTSVGANLERLRALDVVEVGELIVAPTSTGAPGADAEALAATRLARLVEVANGAVGSTYVATDCITRVDENLAALRALQIVELGAFISTQPQNNAYCYNLPCASDITVADVENEARAADLESIALASGSL